MYVAKKTFTRLVEIWDGPVLRAAWESYSSEHAEKMVEVLNLGFRDQPGEKKQEFDTFAKNVELVGENERLNKENQTFRKALDNAKETNQQLWEAIKDEQERNRRLNQQIKDLTLERDHHAVGRETLRNDLAALAEGKSVITPYAVTVQCNIAHMEKRIKDLESACEPFVRYYNNKTSWVFETAKLMWTNEPTPEMAGNPTIGDCKKVASLLKARQ